jgi:hypothetical protein
LKIASIQVVTVLIAVFLFCHLGHSDQEWYEGGALHEATYIQWLKADDHNRLATAANWCLRFPKLFTISKSKEKMALKPYAKALSECVTELVYDRVLLLKGKTSPQELKRMFDEMVEIGVSEEVALSYVKDYVTAIRKEMETEKVNKTFDFCSNILLFE